MRATALRCIRRVIVALEMLAPVFITWPNEEKVEEIKNGFFSNSTFPNVLGAIDGTHINIPAPHEHQETYVNRKGHHSIQLQAVCDHKRRFIHCYVGNVGSVHDQRVFRLSELKNYLDDATKFPNNTHLIGDSAYTLHEHLMVPYRDNGHLTQKQKNFNFCHSSARMAIERSFGLVKGRFRSLLTTLDMKRVDLIPKYIIACCILHNICLLQNDEFPGLSETTPVNENIQARGELVAINRQGAFKRDNLCDQLPFRHI
ncbi:unnamed protein product [Macrosiphum euphorbiae]|nr:unnamed protein product [Macrosiphum euphorbiae]